MIDDKPVRISYSDLVGCTIAFLRETRGREVNLNTRAALAKSIGITPGPYGKLEFGKTVCTVSHLFRIAESLQLSPSDILTEVDKHLFAIKANPSLKVEGHFEAESPAKIDIDIEHKGLRAPRGLVHFFVFLGHRSWRAIDAILTPIISAYTALENDQDFQNDMSRIVDNYEGKIRWVDYESFVDDYFETAEAKASLKEIIEIRTSHPEGLDDIEVNELINAFSTTDVEEYRKHLIGTLAANSLKRRKSKKFAAATGDILGVISAHSRKS